MRSMNQFKNELIQYGKTYRKQGNTELSKSFLDTASLVKDLYDIYKKKQLFANGCCYFKNIDKL